MPRTRSSSDQVVDLTQDDDESLSDFHYAMLLQEQEIANAESIFTDPQDHLFYAHTPVSSRVSRNALRRNNRSIRYQPFPVAHVDDSFDDSYEALLDLSDRIGDAKPKGIPQTHVDMLPSRTVVSKVGSCSICLSDYEVGEMLKGLPCTHWYHLECIETWLKESRFCPVYVKDN